MLAATAAADPPLDPPGTLSGSTGLRTGPYAEFSFDDPIANSSQFSFPSRTAPAASSLATAVQSYGGSYPCKIFDPAVAGTPRIVSTSLMPTGTPASAGSGSPFAASASTRAACTIARSFERLRYTFR